MSSLSFCHALARRVFTAVLLLAAVVSLAHDPRPAVDLEALSSDVLWDAIQCVCNGSQGVGDHRHCVRGIKCGASRFCCPRHQPVNESAWRVHRRLQRVGRRPGRLTDLRNSS